jgi:two-component system sensor histidine kinase CpxA
MRSIFAKILLWCCITLIVCLAGSMFTGQWRRLTPGRHDFLSRSLAFQLEEARDAYETGGDAGLRAYFARIERHFPGTYALVDEHGTDVLTRQDRSEQMRMGSASHNWRVGRDRMTMAWPAHDGKYTLLINAVVPPGPPSPIPYYIWIIVATVVFGYILAVQLASPLHTLEQTVERFGRGDFAVRAWTERKDEFGELGRAFNVMADRIEMLLTAERRLLQDVSHELRSPLARLEFAVELARTSPDREKSLDRIKKEVTRLATLVSELLQVTRAEGDPESRNLQELTLMNLLRDVVDDNALEAQARGCQLKLAATDRICVRGDRELLRRAVENVLRNAIRYAPEHTAVEVKLQESGEKAIICIRDYGPGVPTDSLPNLFKPFFRVHADRDRKSGGVGLGLSIAERAVAVHQGTIRAANANPGLLVDIELPLAPARAVTEPVTV